MIVGLPGAFEAEAVDRDHMRMPAQMDAVVAAVIAAQPRTAVVLCNGAPVEMPWVAGAKAVLEMYLGGQVRRHLLLTKYQVSAWLALPTLYCCPVRHSFFLPSRCRVIATTRPTLPCNLVPLLPR